MPSGKIFFSLPAARVDKKAASVRRMFNSIARRYDRANHWLSFGMDLWWRRRLRQRLSAHHPLPSPRILDLCCGTGDLAFELSRLGRVTGVDFAHSMLQYAGQKAQRYAAGSGILWLEADALQLPFPVGTFDIASVAFGIRNFENLRSGLAEALRVVRPGGILAVLEFSRPRRRWFAALYRFYSQIILPRLGGWITGFPEAYRYLPASVALFSSPREVCTLLSECGAEPLLVEEWTGGIVTCYLAKKIA